MSIAGFTSLGMPINLTEPAYLEHVSSVFLFSLRVYKQNWPLCIGPLQHIWELPVLRYHSIRGNYHYPFLGVTFLVILHDFIRQNYHKNQSDRYPFSLIMVNYPTFFINYHILNFQMYYQYFIFFIEYPKNASNFFLSAICGIEFLIETIVSDF